MLDKRFLQEYGLYRKFKSFVTDEEMFPVSPCPSLQFYCPTCELERTWNEDTQRRHPVGHAKRQGKCVSTDSAGNFRFRLAVTYYCSGCEKEEIYFILLFGGNPSTTANEGQGTSPYVMKIGQYPPWSIEPPKELKAVLGEYEDLYKRGTICESQGYGIGAFAYYRRIVEDMIDQLLADIANLIEPQEREKYRASLAAIEATIVAEKKIEVVKDMLPSILRPGGINPLQTLHDALSVGIHALDEDDCLALAEGIRQSLAMLCKHIALAKQDMEEYATKITSVKERLDKIKKKSEGK